jgi:ribosomal protein S27AE
VSVETPPPAAEQDPAAQQRCPRCGAAMTERQEWCLNCGAAVGTRIVAAPGWRTPIAIAGVILALAAIAVAIAIVQLADDTDQVAQNPAAAAPTPAPAAPTATPEATPTLPEASGKETPEPTATPGTGGTGSANARWPAGKSGWTVVLASDSSESDARDKAKGFAANGIAGVGVLDSDDFSSLRGGYWVVFAGRYDSQSEASDALDGVDAKDAYIRRIEPN